MRPDDQCVAQAIRLIEGEPEDRPHKSRRRAHDQRQKSQHEKIAGAVGAGRVSLIATVCYAEFQAPAPIGGA